MKNFILLISLTLAKFSFGHSFHVGLAKVDYDEAKNEMYATIQLEYQDLAHWVEDEQEIILEDLVKNKKKSKSWDSFDLKLQKHFYGEVQGTKQVLTLFDIELDEDGRIFIYLFKDKVAPFKQIDFVFSLLMGHSEDQQNKLEFKYFDSLGEKTYFAYFFENQTKQTIKIS